MSVQNFVFNVTLYNNSGETKTCRLKMTIMLGAKIVAFVTTTPFEFDASQQIIIDNNNFLRQTHLFSADEIGWDDDFKTSVARMSSFPSGIYHFNFEIWEEGDDTNIANGETIVEINNPSTLDLIAPGNDPSFGEIIDIYETNPTFIWESDFTWFELLVVKKNSADVDPEAVITNGIRVHQTFIRVGEGDDLGLNPFETPTNVYRYPESADDLIAGETYYWQMTAHVITDGSLDPNPSVKRIWAFNIVDLSQGTGDNLLTHPIHQTLSTLLDDYYNYFDEGQQLFGFQPTGNITINERLMSIGELQRLVQSLVANGVTILNVEILP